MAEFLAQTDRGADAALMQAIATDREMRNAPEAALEAVASEAAPEAGAEPAQTPEAAAETEASPEGEASEPEAQAAPEAADADADEIELSRMADLINYVGAEESSMYDLTVPVTVDGKPVDVPIGQLKDAYRATSEATRMQEEAKALREEAATQAREAQMQYQTQLAEGQALVQNLEQAALERFQNINWDELRTTDPSEWTAKRMELQAAQSQIEQVKQSVGEKLTAYQTEMKQQQDAAYETHLQREREALHAAWPEMADPEKGKEERSALIEELKSRGFQDAEIGNAADHRLLLMARDAMRYRQSAQKVDAVRKKVVKIQKKVLQPGAASAKAERGNDAINKAAKALKDSGSHKDFAKWLGEVRRRS